MTSQRPRPATRQRRLSIQASSRRSQSLTGQTRPSRNPYTTDRLERDDWPERDGGRHDHRNDDHPWQGAYDDQRWHESYDDQRFAHRDDGRLTRYESDRFEERAWQEESWHDHRGDRRQNGRSELDQDLQAMAVVWSMIRQGAVRMLGEIGRQY